MIGAEIIYFFLHLTLLEQTFVVAIHLALIFATVFCYFTLRMYAQTGKTEKLMHLREDLPQSLPASQPAKMILNNTYWSLMPVAT